MTLLLPTQHLRRRRELRGAPGPFAKSREGGEPRTITRSQTTQLEGEAKSPGRRQVRGRLGLELPRPGRGKAGVRAIGQLRATLWASWCSASLGTSAWTGEMEAALGGHRVDGRSLLHGPSSGLCLLSKSRAVLGERAAGGFGLQLSILPGSLQRRHLPVGLSGQKAKVKYSPSSVGLLRANKTLAFPSPALPENGAQSDFLCGKLFLEIQITQKRRWSPPILGWSWRR